MRRGFALLLAGISLAGCGAQDTRSSALRVVATPLPTSEAAVKVKVPKKAKNATPTARPAAPRVAAPAAKPARPAPAPAPVVGIAAFTSLGSWIDVFDFTDDPKTVVPLVRSMAAKGVKTLYFETARYTSPTDIQFPKATEAALDEAKSLGMRVVAWYPPGFDDVGRDVRRSLAAINYRTPDGNRFDAFAADIEYTQAVPEHGERNERAIEYTKRLRAGAGASYPIAAIVIPPTSLELNPDRWPNFPWDELKGSYQVFMPMNYWTARSKDAKTADELTRANVQKTRTLTGRPVHIIGGLGEYSDESQTSAYVKAALESGSLGGGLYDFTTTRSEVWDELRRLV